jgi:hypothetical protein
MLPFLIPIAIIVIIIIIIVAMGAQVSKTSYEQVNTQINRVTSNLLSQFEVENKTKVDVIQKIKLTVDDLKCQRITLTNDANIAVNSLSKIDNQQIIQLNQTLIREIQNELKKQLSQSQKGISFGTVQVNKDSTKIKNYVESEINNSVTTIIKNTISTSGTNDQIIELYVKNWTGEDCTLTNKSVIKMLSDNITDSVMNSLTENEEVTDILTKYDYKQKQDMEGLDIGGIIEGIVSAAMLPFLIPIAIIVIIIIIIVAMGALGGGRKARSQKAIK